MKRLIPAVPFVLFSLVTLVQVPAALAQDLPAGKGKDVVEEVCGACHGADLVASRRATKQGWSYIVDDMVSRGATATNEQIAAINEYLAKNFGQVNVNKAPSAEIASVLEITSDQADAIIKYRTDHGDFKTIDDLKKAPGLETAKLDSKKDRVVY
ncbi:MAG TPA: helix-hairpin-helix domain-containing protein [Bryobacteraceae bacterium]|jgi:competence protein ComEA|nr:helix-hairpin-helix domain-containing protein [Bryobacteraceae bacterium]